MVSLVQGTNIVRKEHGIPEAECIAADREAHAARHQEVDTGGGSAEAPKKPSKIAAAKKKSKKK